MKLITDTPVLELLRETIRTHQTEAERSDKRVIELDEAAIKERAAAARYRAAVADMTEALERLYPTSMLAEPEPLQAEMTVPEPTAEGAPS